MSETHFFSAIEMTTVGIYVVKDTANSEPSDVGIVIEGVVALRDLENVALASAMLFGLFYALNMQYPTKLRYTFEVIQKIIMEVDAGELSGKVQSLKTKLHQWRDLIVLEWYLPVKSSDIFLLQLWLLHSTRNICILPFHVLMCWNIIHTCSSKNISSHCTFGVNCFINAVCSYNLYSLSEWCCSLVLLSPIQWYSSAVHPRMQCCSLVLKPPGPCFTVLITVQYTRHIRILTFHCFALLI